MPKESKLPIINDVHPILNLSKPSPNLAHTVVIDTSSRYEVMFYSTSAPTSL